MTQDTEDVVALSDEAIEAAAYQLRAVLDDGYDYETALRSALEMLGVETKFQSLSDRIDGLEGVVDDAASCLKEAGHTISRLEHGSLGNRNFAYVAADHARAALHQEGIATGEER